MLKVVTPNGPLDHANLLEMCEGMTDQFVDTDLEEFDTGALLDTLTGALNEAGLDIDPFLTNLGRGLLTLEGTVHLVTPQINIMNVLIDYPKSSFDAASIERAARNTLGQALDSAAATVALPSKVNETLDMLQKGHVKVGMQLSSTEQLSRDIRAAAGLVAISLIAMSFVIGSCILGASGTSIHLAGVPIVGGLGLVVGIVLGIFVFLKTQPYLK